MIYYYINVPIYKGRVCVCFRTLSTRNISFTPRMQNWVAQGPANHLSLPEVMICGPRGVLRVVREERSIVEQGQK